MIIVCEYKDGRVKEFDASLFSPRTSLPTGRGASCVLVEYDLRLDQIEEIGLCLDIFCHNAGSENSEPRLLEGVYDENGMLMTIETTARTIAVSVPLIAKKNLHLLSRVLVQRAGSTVQAVWHRGEGDWLIIGTKFDVQRAQVYTDAGATSTNAQAVQVFKYLKKANPNMTDEELCSLMGYPVEAYESVRSAEVGSAVAEESLTAHGGDVGAHKRAGGDKPVDLAEVDAAIESELNRFVQGPAVAAVDSAEDFFGVVGED